MVQNVCSEVHRMSTLWVYLYANHHNYTMCLFNFSLHQALFYFYLMVKSEIIICFSHGTGINIFRGQLKISYSVYYIFRN